MNMKTILNRVFAYAVDLLILLLVSSILTNISFLNPQLKNYNKYYGQLSDYAKEYNSFISDLEKYYKDGELSEENYTKLIENHKKYEESLSKYYEDSKLSKKEYKKLESEAELDYQKKYEDLAYKIAKNSSISSAIYIIVTILYFGIFNLVTDGQTLGKKLFKLKIVSSVSDDSKPNIVSYLIRSVLLYNTIYYLVSLIGIYTLNKENYYLITNIVYQIQYYIQIIIICMVMLRADGRGLHDILAKTKVISINDIKDGISEEKKTTEPKKAKSRKKKTVIEAEVEE
jgi:uncharacterized RDD family membrane protein YckC